MSNLVFHQNFVTFIQSCTEDYLIRHANKGLVNRARKDLDKGAAVEFELGNEAVTCRINDGTVCTLTESMERWSCSCPSPSLCKHVLMAIFAYQAQLTDGMEDEQTAVEAPARDFSWLLSEELPPLLAGFKPGALEEAWFRIRYDEELAIQRDTLLTVRLLRQDVEVSYPEEPGALQALCRVEGAEAEILKAEALLRYRRSQGIDDTEAMQHQVALASYSAAAVSEIRSMLEQLLHTGLARLPETSLYQLETLAVAAHSGGLPEVERRLRALKGELELFFARHVRFGMPRFLMLLSTLALALRQLEQGGLPPAKQAELVGVHRTRYYTVPQLRLYGLGADPWETASGYRGTTYYFYCEDDRELYTYTDVRPLYYEGGSYDYAAQYLSFTPWQTGMTLSQLGKSQLVLRGIKVNRERRLSSGEVASLRSLPREAIETVAREGLLHRSDTSLLEEDDPRLFVPRPERVVLLKLSRIKERGFDIATQTLLLLAEGAAGDEVRLELPYTPEWAGAFKRLEQLSLERLTDFYALVRIEAGTLRPISFLRGTEVTNLKLDTY